MTNKIGDCEDCDTSNVQVFLLMPGNMWLCEKCHTKNMTAMAALNNKVVQESRKIDTSLRFPGDVYNAKTVPLTELRAAIENDVEIRNKNLAFFQECLARHEALDKVIFGLRQQLAEANIENRVILDKARETYNKLQAEERAQYKEYDANYQPKPKTTKPKPTKPVSGSGKFGKAERTALYEAAKKYNVPADTVRGIVLSTGKSYDEAAKQLSQMMGH